MRTLYVEPLWGLANRLRTVSGAYAASKLLGCRWCVVWNVSEHMPRHISELFKDVPTAARFPQAARLIDLGERCEYTFKRGDFGDDDIDVAIRCCAFQIPHRETFYVDTPLTDEMQAAIARLVHGCFDQVGVHVRQGDKIDVRNNNFFGPFAPKPLRVPRGNLPCCESKTDLYCNRHCKTVSEYVREIRRALRNGDRCIVVATDRNECVGRIQDAFPALSVVCTASPEDGHERDPCQALVHMFMLAACRRIIGNGVSSFSNECRVIGRAMRDATFRSRLLSA